VLERYTCFVYCSRKIIPVQYPFEVIEICQVNFEMKRTNERISPLRADLRSVCKERPFSLFCRFSFLFPFSLSVSLFFCLRVQRMAPTGRIGKLPYVRNLGIKCQQNSFIESITGYRLEMESYHFLAFHFLSFT
jgi:hypothetical protein